MAPAAPVLRRKLEGLVHRATLPMRMRRWAPHTRLFLADDGIDWVLANETREIAKIARALGIPVASASRATGARRQCVYYASQFVLLDTRHFLGGNRIALAYFHGRPTPEEPTFETCYRALRDRHTQLARVHVSHREMRDFVLGSGIEPAKVHLIPIGVRVEHFPLRTPASSAVARERLGIPRDAVVVGSFQKDGVGWGHGSEPKLIKGPDVLLDTMARVRPHVPALFVLLSGPARGFVRTGLERVGIPFRHVYPRDYRAVAGLYQAIDVYAITSRQEGGPKAVLEAMSSGVPLVTTRVGQATDLVRHGENGWIVDVEDVDGLVRGVREAIDPAASTPIVAEARRTAEANRYEAQHELWARFFDGFMDRV